MITAAACNLAGRTGLEDGIAYNINADVVAADLLRRSVPRNSFL